MDKFKKGMPKFVIAISMLLLCTNIFANDKDSKLVTCDGKFDKIEISDGQLKLISTKHSVWAKRNANLTLYAMGGGRDDTPIFSYKSSDEQYANLCNARIKYLEAVGSLLNFANLQNTYIDEVNFEGAIFVGAAFQYSKFHLNNFKSGLITRALFSHAIITSTDFSYVTGDNANFTEAYLGTSSFLKADLSYSTFSNADLNNNNFANAKMVGVDFNGAVVLDSNFDKAEIVDGRFVDASIQNSAFNNVNLNRADLSDVFVRDTQFKKSDFTSANLSKAEFVNNDFVEANFTDADLSNSSFKGNNLSKATMVRTNLHGSNLQNTNLRGLKCIQCDLSNVSLNNADLSYAQYEPINAPKIGSLGGIKGLSTVWFTPGNESGLILLRNALKRSGLRELEREVTYAIESGRTSQLPVTVQWIKRVMFEYTVGYGLFYGRPLMIMFGLMFVFALFYIIALVRSNNSDTGIYQYWGEDDFDGKSDRVIISDKHEFKLAMYAMYFSVLSAFRVGWRDLNVGAWISRIQPRDYTLQAKGWVKTVSGIQSLISVYLFALWGLSYFGRPFQ